MSAMPYEHASAPDWEGGVAMRHLLLPPADPEAQARVARLRELGLGDQPVPEFDDFARKLAENTGGTFALVNFIDDRRQYFAGMYSAVADTTVELDPAASASPGLGRVMPVDQGFCPHVIARRKALVLEDVRDYPRFAGNPGVDLLGIHSYLGAPLIDRTGLPLGTICVIDQDPQPWGREGLETVKTMAAELMEQINAMG
jgi:GAF domain-containing protein